MKYLTLTLIFSFLVSADQLFSNPLENNELIFSSDKNEPSLEEMWDGLWPFQGINTFAHLEHHKCLLDRETNYDIAVVGVPFDTATSYRPGARFGPRAIRSSSQRQTALRGFNQRAFLNPYDSWAKIIDCGDMPITPMDNSLAFKQMNKAFEELLLRRHSKQNKNIPPRYIALGGDHSVLLPHLRSLNKIYGPVNVIHFDAHLDTWSSDKYPSFWNSEQSEINHGSMLWVAHEEGLTSEYNIHAGLRTKLSGIEDYLDDEKQNFTRIDADDIWVKGVDYVINTILETIPADTPTYISVDIDVLDPGFGSGTGTQEPGGWLPRELIYVLRHIDNLSIVGADVVEVSPAFDNAEITSTNGAQVAYEILTSMVKKGSLENLVVDQEPNELVKIKKVPKTATKEEIKQGFYTNKDSAKMLEKLRELEELKQRLTREIQEMKNMQYVYQ